MNYAELARRLENICRLGTVESIDHQNQRITVNLGDIVTKPIRWIVTRSGKDSTWDAPSIGEEVAVIAPCGELSLAFALPSFYNEAHPSPSTSPSIKSRLFEDGTVISYDIDQHSLLVDASASDSTVTVICNQALINAKSNVTVDTPQTTITGDVTIQKNLNVAINTNVGGSLGVTGNSNISGSANFTGGSVTHQGKNIGASHKHSEVEKGGDESGEVV